MNRHIKIRMKCTAVTPGANDEVVTLAAQGKSGAENQTFHVGDGEPAASAAVTITNKDAAGSFVVGKYYKAVFTPVET